MKIIMWKPESREFVKLLVFSYPRRWKRKRMKRVNSLENLTQLHTVLTLVLKCYLGYGGEDLRVLVAEFVVD